MVTKQVKSIVLALVTISVFLVLLCATSYALWSFSYKGNNSLLQKQSIEIEFLESNDVINLTNAVPISDKEGMVQSEAFDFQVKTKTKSNTSIGYNIVLEKVEIEDGYTVLNDNKVKIYLTDTDNKGLIEPTLVSDLEDYKIYKKYHRHNKEKEEVISKYRIRMWMDESVTGEGWDENTKITYSFKIGVKALEGETYDVVFNSNNGLGEEKVQHIAYNEELELEKNTFKKAGYRFIGWSTTSSGSVVYQDRQKVKNLSGENESITLYAVWEVSIFDVEVVVQNGIIEDEVSKRVNYKEEEVFKLKPNSVDAPATVSCTNNQVGNIKYNKLTVSDVTKNTVCTVVYAKDMTTLYSDGTLIINEYAKDRASNIEKHGTVTNEYEGMSESNSYVMTSEAGQPWKNERTLITDVELGQEISPVSTAYWFRETRNMETGDFTKLNTSQVVDMQYMFSYSGYSSSTYNLIGLATWDTSKVINMRYLFERAGYTTTTSYDIGDLSNWDVSKVENMSFLFRGTGRNTKNWTIGKLNDWDVSNVKYMSNMFQEAGRETFIWNIGNLSNWNTSKVTAMNSMFASAGYNSTEWFIGNISNWDVSSVTNMSYMMYYSGNKITTWTVGDLSNWDVSNVENMSYMFRAAGYNNDSWTVGDLSGWDVSNVSNVSYMFSGSGYNSTEWSIGDISNWDVSNVTDMSNMFRVAGFKSNNWNIGDLSAWNVSKVTNMSNMFSNVGKKTLNWTIGNLSSWDTSKVTDMSYMFAGTGEHVTTFNSIGTLNIPANCNTNMMLYYDETKNVSPKFTGNFVINGSLSSYTDMLRGAATDSSARINLYYKNAESEAIVDELISLYGPNGTVSKGNIYKVTE